MRRYNWTEETRANAIASIGAGRPLTVSGLGLDIRRALRLFRQQPGFAFVSISMIALGIAATTSLFSVVDGVLLKPLPNVNTEGLVRAFQNDADFRGRVFSNDAYYAWADEPQTIGGIGAWNDVTLSIEGGDALLLDGFAAFALLIAVIGLFGGLSYGVAQRTREIGVRTALATPRQIMRLVLKQGGAMTVVGLVIGLGAAAATGRYLTAFLFGVAPIDPLTFVFVGAAISLTALVACAIPARRAARIDAIEALRRS